MRKVSMAERVLSLATTPERASVIVGDLVETGGPLWSGVIGTASSLMWRDAVGSPWRVLLTGGGIFLRQFITGLLVGMGNFIAFRGYGLKSGPSLAVYLSGWIVVFGLTQYLLGRELRRNSRHHGLAAFAVVGTLNLVATLGWNLHMVSVPMVVWQIPMLLGMLISKPTQTEDPESSHRPC